MSNHTICGLSQSGLNGRQPRRTPVLKANQKKHEWNLPFSHFLQCHISSDAKMKLAKKITQRLLWNMEEARLCSWACFGASGTAGLKNLKTIKASWSEMLSPKGTLQTTDSWSSFLLRSVDECRRLTNSYKTRFITMIASEGCVVK